MLLGPSLLEEALDRVRKKVPTLSPSWHIQELHGGQIASCYKLSDPSNDFPEEYFLKINPSIEQNRAEALGLKLLNHGQFFSTPKLLASEHRFLLLEYHAPENITPEVEVITLAKGLNELHSKQLGHTFGLEEDNYIGSSLQINSTNSDWCHFFWHNRLTPQLERLKFFPKSDWAYLEKFINRELSKVSSQIKPVLLHGDLWGGNFFITNKSLLLFDPAVYYGHSEADLSLLFLFYAPFSNKKHLQLFAQHYKLANMEGKGFFQRQLIYQFYHALNHYNLFGASYKGLCQKYLSQLLNG